MPARTSVVSNWGAVIATQNLPEGRRDGPRLALAADHPRERVPDDAHARALIGGLLAVAAAPAAQLRFFLALALLGLVVAHAANNMINDYFDVVGGVDTDGYVRTVYAPHPILSGLISKERPARGHPRRQPVDLAILVDLVHGARLAGARRSRSPGLFISVFYVAPPLKLKHHGLGEPGVAVVWGPLMIGGTYYVTTGQAPLWVFAREPALCDARDDRAVRQARRQARIRQGQGHPHAAGHPRPRRRAGVDARDDGRRSSCSSRCWC